MLVPSIRLGLIIFNPVYDPSYKPVIGRLALTCNGFNIIIKVNGVSIHSCIRSPELDFCVDIEQVAPQDTDWEKIVHTCLTQIFAQAISNAECQRIYLQGEGAYYVQ